MLRKHTLKGFVHPMAPIQMIGPNLRLGWEKMRMSNSRDVRMMMCLSTSHSDDVIMGLPCWMATSRATCRCVIRTHYNTHTSHKADSMIMHMSNSSL